mgnify:CR=1 FL=1
MGIKARSNIATFFKYAVLIIVGCVMVYPLLWMISETFKTNSEILTSMGRNPQKPTFEGEISAMNNLTLIQIS